MPSETGREIALTLRAKDLSKDIITRARDSLRQLGIDTDALSPKFEKSFGLLDKGASASASTLKGLASTLGLAFGGAAILGGLRSFGAELLADAGRINDLSNKLGVNTTKFQQWTNGLELSGGSMGELNTSLSFMNKTLGEGSKGTVKLLDDLGLGFGKVRAMKAEDAFEAIVTKIESMPNPLDQVRVAVELFGKSGQNMLPAIRDHFLEVGRASAVMSEESIRNLDRLGDEWDEWWKRQANNAKEFGGQIAKHLNEQADRHRAYLIVLEGIQRKGVSVEERTRGESPESLASKAVQEMTAGTIEATIAIDAAAKAQHGLTDAVTRGAAADGNRNKMLALATIEYQTASQRVGQLADQTDRGGKATKTATAGVSDYARQLQRMSAAYDEIYASVDDLNDLEYVRAQELLAAGHSEKVVADFLMVREASVRKLKIALDDIARADRDGAAARSAEIASLEALGRHIVSGGIQPLERWLALRAQVTPLTLAELGATMPNAFDPGKGRQAPDEKLDLHTADVERLAAATRVAADEAHALDREFDFASQTLSRLGPAGNIIGGVVDVMGQMVTAHRLAGAAAKDHALDEQASAAASSAAWATATGVVGLFSAAAQHWIAEDIKFAGAFDDRIHAALLSGEDLYDMQGRYIDQTQVAIGLQRLLTQAVTGTGQNAADALAELDRLFNDYMKLQQAGGLFSDRFADFLADAREARAEIAGMSELMSGQQQRGEIAIERALQISGNAARTQAQDAADLAKLRSDHLSDLADLEKQYRDASSDDDRARAQTAIATLNQTFTANETALQHNADVQAAILRATSVDSTQEADAMTGVLLGGMAARQNAGESYITALRGQKGAVDDLELAMQAGHVGGTAMFETLRRKVALATDEIGGPALEAMDDIIQAQITMANRGELTAEMFSAMSGSIGQTVTALEAEGKSHEDVMSVVTPDLQRVWEMQQRYNYALDDTTQKLVNEAVESGAVGEEHLTMQERQERATETQTTAIVRMAEIMEQAFGDRGPAALETLARKSRDVFGDMTTDIMKVPTRLQFTAEGSVVFPDGSSQGPKKFEAPGFAEGTHGEFVDFGRGTPVILHGRERVVTERERYVPQVSATTTGGDVHIHINLNAPNAAFVDKRSINQLLNTRELQDALISTLRSSGELRTRMGQVLGIPRRRADLDYINRSG